MAAPLRIANTSDPLTSAEENLLHFAARFYQAMIYWEQNDVDEEHYDRSIAKELVSSP